MRLRVLIICLVLLAAPVFAGDDDDKPAPRFRAKTTASESFNNECKRQSRAAGILDHLVPVLPSGRTAGRAINKEFGDKGLIVLAIDVAESKKTVKKYLEQHPRACRIVLTEDTNLAAMYQANSYPIYVVIDRDGNISGEQRGAGGERALRRLLARAGIEAEEKTTEN